MNGRRVELKHVVHLAKRRPKPPVEQISELFVLLEGAGSRTINLGDEINEQIVYMESMKQETKTTLTVEQRLTALEEHYLQVDAQLDDIREVISSSLDQIFASNASKAEALRHAADRLDKIEERLVPVFAQVFPRHGAFIAEVDDVLRCGRDRG